MNSLLDRLLGRKDQRSAKTALERLQFVLVTDRSQLTPEQLRQMQAEILDVIRKYCKIDEGAVEMKLEARERENYLVADIPLAQKTGQKEDEAGRIGFSMQTSTPSEPVEEDKTDAKDKDKTAP